MPCLVASVYTRATGMTWAVEVVVFIAVGTQVHVVSAGEFYYVSCSRMSTSSQIFLRLENSIPSHRCAITWHIAYRKQHSQNYIMIALAYTSMKITM